MRASSGKRARQPSAEVRQAVLDHEISQTRLIQGVILERAGRQFTGRLNVNINNLLFSSPEVEVWVRPSLARPLRD